MLHFHNMFCGSFLKQVFRYNCNILFSWYFVILSGWSTMTIKLIKVLNQEGNIVLRCTFIWNPKFMTVYSIRYKQLLSIMNYVIQCDDTITLYLWCNNIRIMHHVISYFGSNMYAIFFLYVLSIISTVFHSSQVTYCWVIMSSPIVNWLQEK